MASDPVGWVTSIVKQAEASQKRINEFLDSKTSLRNGKNRLGKIKNMTGISAPYEIPVSPDLEIDTVKDSIDKSVDKIFKFLEKKLYE